MSKTIITGMQSCSVKNKTRARLRTTNNAILILTVAINLFAGFSSLFPIWFICLSIALSVIGLMVFTAYHRLDTNHTTKQEAA